MNKTTWKLKHRFSLCVVWNKNEFSWSGKDTFNRWTLSCQMIRNTLTSLLKRVKTSTWTSLWNIIFRRCRRCRWFRLMFVAFVVSPSWIKTSLLLSTRSSWSQKERFNVLMIINFNHNFVRHWQHKFKVELTLIMPAFNARHCKWDWRIPPSPFRSAIE